MICCWIFLKLKIQIEEAILTNRQEHLKHLAGDCEVSLEQFDETVQPIINSCTKDAILVRDLNLFVFKKGKHKLWVINMIT